MALFKQRKAVPIPPEVLRLRRKIVAIVMGLTSFVLVVTNAISVVTLFNSLNGIAKSGLTMAVEEGPFQFEKSWVGERISSDTARQLDEESGTPGKISLTIYCASVDEDGTVTSSNADAVSIRPDVLEQAIDMVLDRDREYGRLNSLTLMYARMETPTGYNIALLDASAFDSILENGIWSTVMRIMAALVMLLAVSVVLARYATTPIARAMQRQKRFISDASHELKTPLTVILASAKIMAKHPDQSIEQNSEWVSSIQEEGERMQSLVERLVEAARASEKSGEEPKIGQLEHEAVDFSELAERSALQFEAVAFERGVDFTWSIPPAATVSGNPGELEQLVKILLDNAMKYAGPPRSGDPAMACVNLSIRRIRETVELVVSNTG